MKNLIIMAIMFTAPICSGSAYASSADDYLACITGESSCEDDMSDEKAGQSFPAPASALHSKELTPIQQKTIYACEISNGIIAPGGDDKYTCSCNGDQYDPLYNDCISGKIVANQAKNEYEDDIFFNTTKVSNSSNEQLTDGIVTGKCANVSYDPFTSDCINGKIEKTRFIIGDQAVYIKACVTSKGSIWDNGRGRVHSYSCLCNGNGYNPYFEDCVDGTVVYNYTEADTRSRVAN